MLVWTVMVPLSSIPSYAQKTTVLRGTVSSGEPMPGPLAGATVKNVTTGKGVVTDADGNYEIAITSPKDIIQFRFLGFKDLDKIAGVAARLDVVLEDEYNTLDEIVVVGYGTTKKRDITGSIVSVTKDEIEQKLPPIFMMCSRVPPQVSRLLLAPVSPARAPTWSFEAHPL